VFIHDLGALEDSILIFGGAYSNVDATRSVLSIASEQNIKTLIHTGDAVAYCATPCETLFELRKSGAYFIKGNCEAQLALDAPDCGCGFEDGSTCDLLSVKWYDYARMRILDADKAWMDDMADWIIFRHAGKRYVVVHGGATHISRFIFSVTPQDVFEEEIAAITHHIGPIDAVICGHSGIAFDREISGIHWINAGVIGMPPHDGDPRTQYGILKNGKMEFHRLSYDFVRAQNRMQSAGQTYGYETSLVTGYWPSEDVLPPQLRRAKG